MCPLWPRAGAGSAWLRRDVAWRGVTSLSASLFTPCEWGMTTGELTRSIGNHKLQRHVKRTYMRAHCVYMTTRQLPTRRCEQHTRIVGTGRGKARVTSHNPRGSVRCFRVMGLNISLYIPPMRVSSESVEMTPIFAHILLDHGRVRHRDQRAERLQMIDTRHPPMIGVLPISCVLALIWAQEEN